MPAPDDQIYRDALEPSMNGSDRGFKRRAFLTGALSLAVSGCVANPLFKSLGESFSARRKQSRQGAFSAQDVARLPYASMGVRIGESRQALVVLAKNINDDLYWVTADQLLFVTRFGRLIRTNGLIKDLKTTRFGALDPVQTGLQRVPPGGETLVRFVDLRPAQPREKDVAATSVFHPKEEDVITILGQPRVTLRVEEHVSYWRWNWHVKNQYWVDPGTGFVWKSLQHTAPQLGVTELEMFKPAAKLRA
ncbi:MAG: YjbF family lipoprotein [Nevskiales bacterium]